MSQRFAESDSREGLVEEPVDARRYIEALRDGARLILGLAAAIAVLVWLISLALPKRYTATAKIAPSVQATTSSASGSPAQTNFATLQAYVTSPTVLASAGRKLGASPTGLQQKVTTSLDANANIVNITANDGDARRSAQIANGVAEAFLSARTAAERAQLAAQANSLTQKMSVARAAGSSGLASALQQQISSVLAQEASAGSDLQMLALAPVPAGATSPRPARNAFFAFVAVLFIGVLAVLGRELLTPSISGDRELSALMRMPVLGRVPRIAPDGVVRRTAADPAEAEAYRFLSKSIDLAAWPSGCRVLAVTSAVSAEGKTTVVSKLGAAFAEAGSRTLLVGADLRRPVLDRVFGLTPGDGLGNILSSPNGNRAAAEPSQIEQVGENLSVLPSGRPLHDPAAVITNDAVRSLFERVRQLGFEYVLFDLPPLIAAAETQLFVRYADGAMVVSMVGRATAEQLLETRELLDRLPVWPAGIVVLGVRPAVRDAPGTTSDFVARQVERVRQQTDQRSARSRPESHPEPREPVRHSDRPEPPVIPERAPSSPGQSPSSAAEPSVPAATPEPAAPASSRRPRQSKALSAPASSAEPTSTTPSRRPRQRKAPSAASSQASSPEPTSATPPRRTRQQKEPSEASSPASPPEPSETTPRVQTPQTTEPPEPPPPK